MTRAQQILKEVGRVSTQILQRARPVAVEVSRQIWLGLKRADLQLDRFIRRRVPASEASLYKTLSLVVISVVGLLVLPLTFAVFVIVVIILAVKTIMRPNQPPPGSGRSSRRLLRDGEERYGRDIDDPPRRRRQR